MDETLLLPGLAEVDCLAAEYMPYADLRRVNLEPKTFRAKGQGRDSI